MGVIQKYTTLEAIPKIVNEASKMVKDLETQIDQTYVTKENFELLKDIVLKDCARIMHHGIWVKYTATKMLEYDTIQISSSKIMTEPPQSGRLIVGSANAWATVLSMMDQILRLRNYELKDKQSFVFYVRYNPLEEIINELTLCKGLLRWNAAYSYRIYFNDSYSSSEYYSCLASHKKDLKALHKMDAGYWPKESKYTFWKYMG